MLTNRHKATSGSSGTISPLFSKGTIVLTLLDFLERVLVAFQIDNSCTPRDIEDLISQHLAIRLNDQARKESLFFIFDRQTVEHQSSGRSRALDFGVFRSYADSYPEQKPFFAIEAKRLPTPTVERSREYVSGSQLGVLTGGIERFKHGVHGNGLPFSSIIGYVQKEEATYWPIQINKWIDSLITNPHDARIEWTPTDKLTDLIQLHGEKVLKLTSINKRIDDSTIQLIHYLILIEA